MSDREQGDGNGDQLPRGKDDDFERRFREAKLNGTIPEFLHRYNEEQHLRDLEERDRRFRGQRTPEELAKLKEQQGNLEPTVDETLQLLEAEFGLRKLAERLGVTPEELLRSVDPDVPQHVLDSLSSPLDPTRPKREASLSEGHRPTSRAPRHRGQRPPRRPPRRPPSDQPKSS